MLVTAKPSGRANIWEPQKKRGRYRVKQQEVCRGMNFMHCRHQKMSRVQMLQIYGFSFHWCWWSSRRWGGGHDNRADFGCIWIQSNGVIAHVKRSRAVAKVKPAWQHIVSLLPWTQPNVWSHFCTALLGSSLSSLLWLLLVQGIFHFPQQHFPLAFFFAPTLWWVRQGLFFCILARTCQSDRSSWQKPASTASGATCFFLSDLTFLLLIHPTIRDMWTFGFGCDASLLCIGVPCCISKKVSLFIVPFIIRHCRSGVRVVTSAL